MSYNTNNNTVPVESSTVLNSVEKYIPIISWLPKYEWRKNLIDDIFAGLALLSVVIPQNMAYASLAGLPSYYGLYTCLMPAIIYIIFGSGSFTAVGTFSLIAIMVKQGSDIIYQNIHNVLAEDIPVNSEYMEIIFALTFWVGAFQLIMGISGVGKFITKYLLPTPAIKGFVTASSLTIITTQISPALGFAIPKVDKPFPVFFKWWYALTHLQSINIVTFLIASLSLLGIIAIRKINGYLERRALRNAEATPLLSTNPVKTQGLPDILLVVILATLFVWVFRLDLIGGVAIVGTVPKGLPSFLALNINYLTQPSLVIHFISPALTIAGTGYVITISASKAYNSPGLYKIREDQELIGIGLSSMIGSMFNSYANCGSLTRTAVLVRSGAKSQIAQLFTTLFLAITMMFLTPLFYFLPKAVLATIVLIACQSLLGDLRNFPNRFRAHFNLIPNTLGSNGEPEPLIHFAMWIAMTLSALALDLQRGLVWGITIVLILQLIPERFYSH